MNDRGLTRAMQLNPSSTLPILQGFCEYILKWMLHMEDYMYRKLHAYYSVNFGVANGPSDHSSISEPIIDLTNGILHYQLFESK